MWEAVGIYHPDGTVKEAHVIPEHDDRKHAPRADCWCEPVKNGDPDSPIYNHRDLLKREGPADPDLD